MKKVGLGSAALFVLSATAALATDMPVKPPVYKAATSFSWAGLYIGAHAGYGWGDFKSIDNVFVAVGSGHLKPSGWLGGGQIGYNAYFAPNWVVGGEVDLSASDLHDSGLTSGAVVPINLKVDYFGTGRVRLGYAFDRSLIYFTGGVAWTHDRLTETSAGAAIWYPGEYHVGGAVGGGYEYALDPHWSAKVEYLYADLGHYRDYVNGSLLRVNDLALNVVRVGLNYRFGDSAPVEASPHMPSKAYSPRFTWTGGYIGANASYAWANLKSFDGFFGPQTSSVSPNAWLGGFQGGYNWQFAGNWVLGFETDSSFGSLSANSFDSPAGLPTSFKIDDPGTVRGRFGYAIDRALIYGTGGLAYARVKFIETAGGLIGGGFDGYRVGWTAGGGLEYAFDPNWSAKIEYLYSDLGTQQFNFNASSRTVDATISTARIGLNYQGSLLNRLFGGH